MTSRDRRASDSGFTLVELLIVIAILPMIVGAISLALIAILSNESGIATKAGNSADAQITSARFVRDVQSADLVTTDASVSSPPLCGAGQGQLVAGFYLTAATSQSESAYWLVGSTLVRRSCPVTVGSGPTYTLGTATSSTVANDVSSKASAAAITPAIAGTDAAGGWTAASGVSGVSISAVEPDGKGSASYNYALTAVPRIWSSATGGFPAGGSPPPPPAPPLLLLGTSGSVFSVNPSFIVGVTVQGPIDVDSNSACAVQMSGGIGDSLSSTGSSAALNIYGYNANPGTVCDGGGFLNSVSPNPTSLATQVADPYASIATPAAPTTSGACTLSGSTWTCTPGYYTAANTPDFTVGGQTINFLPGSAQYGSTYRFEGTSPVTFSAGGDIVTFGSATYIFNGGINVGGFGNSLTSGSGGVLFYIGDTSGGPSTAQATIGGAGNKVILQPLGAPSPYAGILIFQDRGDSQPVVINGSVSYTASAEGIIYAPDAQVQLGGGFLNGLSLAGLIAQSVSINPSALFFLTISGG